MNKEGTLYTVVFIFIVSFAFVFLLSMTNQATIERVRLNEEIARQSAVLSAMGVEATTVEEIREEFARIASDEEEGLFAGRIDGRTVYAKEMSGSGLWGGIFGFLAVTADIQTFVGIEIVDDNETPGLGGRINEPWFKEQFESQRIPDDGITVRAGEADPERGIVDGITGATATSNAMQSIINRTVEQFRSPEIRARLEELAAQLASGGEV